MKRVNIISSTQVKRSALLQSPALLTCLDGNARFRRNTQCQWSGNR